MRNVFYIVLLIVTCLYLTGCDDGEGEMQKTSNMTDKDVYDIYLLFEAPKAKKEHDLTDVIKIVFFDSNSTTGNTIAIDVKDSSIYINPSVSSLGIRATNGMKEIEDIETAINILEKYNVQDWKEDYSIEDPSSYEDGYGWSLLLQFEDGTVAEYGGSGPFKKEITPNHFDDFFQELNDFVEERLGEEV